jgi:Fe-S oxidoreductase
VNSIPPIRIVEPSGRERRRLASGALIGRTAEPDLAAIKSRLGEIRQRSLRNFMSLAEQFRDSVAMHPAAGFKWATDATEAVDYIKGIAGNTRDAVVNRSSVVLNELGPGLEKSGFRIAEPYRAEPECFENSVAGYWDLPRLLSSGITGNFEVSAYPPPGRRPDTPGGAIDCVAVLGVTAAAAEDGSVFFVQHMSNISGSLDEAKHVVLVVGMDRLVKTGDDAEFQARCAGIFGMEAMLLNLGAGRDGRYGMESLPRLPGPVDRSLHVVLLDNGRSRLPGTAFEDLLLCIGCKACVKQCPISRAMTQDGVPWSPRDYLFMFLLDEARSLDTCLHCEACRTECPLEIDVPNMMWMAGTERAARHGRTLRERMLGNPELLARVGSSAAPVSNVAARNEPGRTLISSTFGLDSRRSLPRFHRRTFKRWFAARNGNRPEALPGRKVAYYTGCFANYYQPEVGRALVGVMERNGFEVRVPDQVCCGMPMMAGKNASSALRNARHNIESLAVMAAEGYDIVTTCPSCSLMIKREYVNLYDSPEARLVSEHVYSVEEFLMLLNRQGEMDTDLQTVSASLLYHVPCHLKVQAGAADCLEMLKLIPGVSVDKINTACCGMAGYHGYKKAHAGLS